MPNLTLMTICPFKQKFDKIKIDHKWEKNMAIGWQKIIPTKRKTFNSKSSFVKLNVFNAKSPSVSQYE